MKNETVEQIWDYLLDSLIATEDELVLVTNINGYSEDSLNSILYAKTGYRSIEQLGDVNE